jgi:hypothetical protein
MHLKNLFGDAMRAEEARGDRDYRPVTIKVPKKNYFVRRIGIPIIGQMICTHNQTATMRTTLAMIP